MSARPRLVVDTDDECEIALRAEQARSGDNKTTIVNESVKLYVHLRAIDAAGGALYVREPGKEKLTRLTWTRTEQS